MSHPKCQQLLMATKIRLGNPSEFDRQRSEIYHTRIHLSKPGRSLEVSSEALEFLIQDSGEGISAEQIDHIFDAFRQSDSSLARWHGGAGLGLSISKSLFRPKLRVSLGVWKLGLFELCELWIRPRKDSPNVSLLGSLAKRWPKNGARYRVRTR